MQRKIPTRHFSSKQEKQVAKILGGKVVPNSGATDFRKGDVTTNLFNIECKTATTEKKSFSIKQEWIDKQREEMFAMGQTHWALAFNFGGLNPAENFYIIDEQLFKRLHDMLQAEMEEQE